MNKKYYLVLLLIAVVVAGIAYLNRDFILQKFFEPTDTTLKQGELISEVADPEIVLNNLNIPWELVFLPDGDMLVTERPGNLLRIGSTREVIQVSGVAHRGEGGLLGLALHPQFASNNFIYLYLTTQSGDSLKNRVERYTLSGTTLSNRTVIIENIPGASNHDGGRIAFGPDGMLYIATGDAGDEPSAQNTQSLAGKILRIKDDGSIPADNPFGNAVYSYGHRNIQGIAWDKSGILWATEHGRSGTATGYDELNKIVKGGNYGWPDVEGSETKSGTISPQIHSGSSETWAPAGVVVVRDSILFTGLRGASLYMADISTGEAKNLTVYLRQEYGRLRGVTLGPDGMLYILTNNRDGRGRPGDGDDKIIKIDPTALGL